MTERDDVMARLGAVGKPVAFLDLEATGITPVSDRIVEIAVVKLFPDGRRELLDQRVNPGVPIPAAASAVHGIRDADVAGMPGFGEIADRVEKFLAGCDLAGFNLIRYDIPMLVEEFKRAGIVFSLDDRSVIDSQVIFHKKEPRSLEAAMRFYCGRAHDRAHSAIGDVEATIDVLAAQLGRYGDLPRDPAGLHELCDQKNPTFVDRFGKLVWKDGEAVFNFGPHRGKTLKDVVASDTGFLDWILRKDFSAELKGIIQQAREGIFPVSEPPAAPDEALPPDNPGDRTGERSAEGGKGQPTLF